MNATHAPALVPADADRDTLIAYLDAHPEWERIPITSPRRTHTHLRWRLNPDIATTVARTTWLSVDLPNDDTAPFISQDREDRYCADAIRVINATALRTDPHDSDDVIARLAAIYRLATPGSDIALIASGQVEPE